MSDDTTTLGWEEALDQAVVPDESDPAFQELLGRRILALDGSKIIDVGLVRERAALKYAEAHEGKEARVDYTDPDRDGGTYVVTGTLNTEIVHVPVFTGDPSDTKEMRGLVVGCNFVPLAGITQMRVKGDNGGVRLMTKDS